MRILFLSDEFSPFNAAGSGVVAYNLAKGLKDRGHDVYIITNTQNKAEGENIDYSGLKIFRIYSHYHPRWQAYLSLYNPQTVLKVRKIIKNTKPDIVHAHNIHYHLSYHCLKIAKKYAKGVFLTAHDIMLVHYGKLMPKKGNCFYKVRIWDQIKEAKKRYNPLRNIIIRHYLKYLDKIFAVSSSLKKLLEVNGIKNIETIYNGIDVNDWGIDLEKNRKFKEKYNLQNKRVIFFGGRLSGAKGGNQILRAVALIRKEIKNTVLLVAGERNKYVEEMERLARELNIEKNIIFIGWLEGADLKSAYYSADVCVCPSICFETFGMNNLEAMACKRPVVSSCFGGPKEVVVDPAEGGVGVQTGYLINPYKINLMVKRILDLLESPEKARKFGEAGYQRAKEYFSLEKQLKETLRYYYEK